MKKLGIYIHFPFCSQKCAYCNFYSLDNKPELISRWIQAVIQEIEIFSDYLQQHQVETIYIGGGSPNLIPPEGLNEIISVLHKYINFNGVREFTIELNPSNWGEDLIVTLEKTEINRVSIGGQAFQEHLLDVLGRQHSPNDINEILNKLCKTKINHLSLDLIFGIPGQTFTDWKDSLAQSLEHEVDHLSLYNLHYADGTPLNVSIQKGEYSPLSEEKEWEMYKFAHDYLDQNGFNHYEISNWAKPGCKSRHNSSYWTGQSYIGFGPGAHSYDGTHRKWNQEDLVGYIENLEDGKQPPSELEKITPPKARLEKLFLSLRTSEGLEYTEIEKYFSITKNKIQSLIKAKLSEFIEEEMIVLATNSVKLTLSGWFASNEIITELANLLEQNK